MPKKRKKIRRPEAPPLAWIDKVIYAGLFLLIIASLPLVGELIASVRTRIACQDTAMLAFRGRLAHLWLVPYLIHLFLGCMLPVIVKYGERKPIIGNKAITYGEHPWKSDVYPMFGPQHKSVKVTEQEMLFRRIFCYLWILGVFLIIVTALFCLCRRNCLQNDQTIVVYDTFNHQTDTISITEDCTELTIEIQLHGTRSGRFPSYGITLSTPDGKDYSFDWRDFKGSHFETLKTMLQIKDLFSPEVITIKGVDKMENVIDYNKLNSEEIMLLRELFG